MNYNWKRPTLPPFLSGVLFFIIGILAGRAFVYFLL